MTVKDLYELFYDVVDSLRLTTSILSFTKKNTQYYTVVVSDSIGLVNYDVITITGTTNFNGTYKIYNLSGTSFDIERSGTYTTESGSLKQLKPYFNIGNWKEISNDLALKGTSKIFDSQRFPFILLHSEMQFKEKEIRYWGKVNPKIYILSQSHQNYSTLERLDNIYNDTLYPLCDKLLYAMKECRYFEFDTKEFKDIRHKRTELFYYNSLGANQNKLNDIVDGIELDFSEIKVLNKFDGQIMPTINFNNM